VGKRSRAKGARGELELAAKLTELLGVRAERTQQFCGAAGDPDVRTPDLPIHWECKRCEALSLYAALDQAIADSNGDVPVVAHRRNEKPWLVILRLEDLLRLASALRSLQEDGEHPLSVPP